MRLCASPRNGHAAMRARRVRYVRRFGYMQPPAWLNLDARNVVPAPQLAERNAKAVGNGHQRIALARAVQHDVRRQRGGRSLRHHQPFHSLQALARPQLVGCGQLGF